MSHLRHEFLIVVSLQNERYGAIHKEQEFKRLMVYE